jgi:hypothetical protein
MDGCDFSQASSRISLLAEMKEVVCETSDDLWVA